MSHPRGPIVPPQGLRPPLFEVGVGVGVEVGSVPPPYAGAAGGLGWKCRHMMSGARQNVANFCPDRPILVTWFTVCRHTFLLPFPNIDVPRTDNVGKYIALPLLKMIVEGKVSV